MGKITEIIKKNIRVIPNFPKKGIQFQDIFSLTEKGKILSEIIKEISNYSKKNKITKIIGIESRGFIFAAAAAIKHNLGFVPIRKKGKLPGKVYKKKYKLEYGYDEIEIQKESVLKKDCVLIVDDLIATGGTAIASAKLLEKLLLKKPEFFFVVDLDNLGGSEKLKKLGYKVTCLFKTIG
tara:strand:- start:129 stop:668 length:540 start_codon:yes stop_codon:yes gene_type:complete